MLFGDHGVVELILLQIEFDDRAGQGRALVDAQPLAHRTGDDVAANDLQRNDLDLADQLFAQVQSLDEMVGHADAVQARHDELADAVVDNALAFQLGLFLAVEGGGVVLEILDQGAGLGSFVEDLGLALVNLLALDVHDGWSGRGATETAIARPDRDLGGSIRNRMGGKKSREPLADATPRHKPGALRQRLSPRCRNPASCSCVRPWGGYRPARLRPCFPAAQTEPR